ncbi:MAG: cytochrome c3 family protein [Deltaproteobacteria bacterium]|nr:cytochrome c3 family protein [Deltaproteobacteria bacterium]
MQKLNAKAKWTVLLATVTLVLLPWPSGPAAVTEKASGAAGRADVIMIDSMMSFGALERPPAVFFHDQHSRALEKMGKDCTACHLMNPEKDRLSIKFKRLEDTGKTEIMELYHAGCIDCHNEQLAADQKAGPVVCAGCHIKTPQTVSSRLPIGMDKSLHYRHSKAMDNKCEACHHEYDEAAKKLVYVKGKEGTCRYCHQAQTVDNKIADRQAFHMDCVDCHRKITAQSKTAGPMECAGCHDAAQQALIEKVANPPRMEMKQPNAVLVKLGEAALADPTLIRMNQVPFDHNAHEKFNSNCRTCHHASLTACSDCHTLSGKKEGDWVKLEQAMHLSRSNTSCIGCHGNQQADKNCAGCHGFMTKVNQPPQSFCNACHQVQKPEMVAVPGPEISPEVVEAAETVPEAEAATEMLAAAETAPVSEVTETDTQDMLAANALASRQPTEGTYDVADIPETVTIKTLEDKYEPVVLPHRKIVLKLADNLKDSQLAKYFHADKGTLCQGCHHNSPVSVKPPQCGSCHGKPFNESSLFRPGLMAAYHQQCMGCHHEMGIEKPANRDCAACHKEKEKRNETINH